MNPFEQIHEQSRRWSVEDEGIELTYDADFFPLEEADAFFRALKSELPWQRIVYPTSEGPRTVPRLTSWHADPPLRYKYGAIAHEWQDWTPTLLQIRTRVEEALGLKFNGVLANFYENEHDSVAFHADDEPEMDRDAPIASVSLGAIREFVVRHQTSRSRHVIPLEHGSLLVMGGATQRVAKHSIPKVRRPCGPRLNLTFRKTLPHT